MIKLILDLFLDLFGVKVFLNNVKKQRTKLSKKADKIINISGFYQYFGAIIRY